MKSAFAVTTSADDIVTCSRKYFEILFCRKIVVGNTRSGRKKNEKMKIRELSHIFFNVGISFVIFSQISSLPEKPSIENYNISEELDGLNNLLNNLIPVDVI